MNRRELFSILAAAALAPGELWVPGRRTVFLPPAGGWLGWDYKSEVLFEINSLDAAVAFFGVPRLVRALGESDASLRHRMGEYVRLIE